MVFHAPDDQWKPPVVARNVLAVLSLVHAVARDALVATLGLLQPGNDEEQLKRHLMLAHAFSKFGQHIASMQVWRLFTVVLVAQATWICKQRLMAYLRTVQAVNKPAAQAV